ncbi:PLDc N-terminal domain-containing protein [Leifsonia poae]|uniref:PLDc N-terminal domain-containing protein n=1 Tax=Leifsonia poae TaxID=110933 RepID=UPI001CBE8F75|nr:PLDc N-terminal domain-containing protein [Leifsonia poae]
MDTLGVVLVAIGVAAGVVYLTVLVIAFVQVFRDREMAWATQLVWLLSILALPVGGTIAWFAVGHRTKEFERALMR